MDNRSLKICFKIAGTLGAVPLGTFNKRKLHFGWKNIVYQISVITLFLWDQLGSGYEEKAGIKFESSVVLVCFIVRVIASYSLILIRLAENIFRNYNWNKFFVQYFHLDNVLKQKIQPRVQEKKRFVSMLFLFSSVGLTLLIWDIVARFPRFTENDPLKLLYFLPRTYFLICFIMSHLLTVVCLLHLQCRYREIDLLMQKLSRRRDEPEIFSRQMMKMAKIYRLAKETADTFNDISGWFVAICFVNAAAAGVEYGTRINIQDISILTPFTVAIVLTIVGSMFLVTGCESVTNEAENLIIHCVNLIEDLPQGSEGKSELLLLSYMFRCNVPVFSGLRLFVIKKSIIFSVMNVTLTYVIVVMQFKDFK